jgi:hypothetical protein
MIIENASLAEQQLDAFQLCASLAEQQLDAHVSGKKHLQAPLATGCNRILNMFLKDLCLTESDIQLLIN